MESRVEKNNEWNRAIGAHDRIASVGIGIMIFCMWFSLLMVGIKVAYVPPEVSNTAVKAAIANQKARDAHKAGWITDEELRTTIKYNDSLIEMEE